MSNTSIDGLSEVLLSGDSSTSFAGGTVVALVAILGTAGFGAWVALAGRPLMRDLLLEGKQEVPA